MKRLNAQEALLFRSEQHLLQLTAVRVFPNGEALLAKAAMT